MKTLFLLALTVASAWAVPHPRILEQWNNFKVTHKKEYSTPLEEAARLEVFQSNLAAIEEHNEKYAKGEVTYTKALNQFGDMTNEEFLAYVNRGKASQPKIDSKLRRPFVAAKAPVAAEVDWRNQGAVAEVKDQGRCGACWSFSATGAIEGQLAITGSGLVSLSEQNLIDCSTRYGNQACIGGWIDTAFDYVHDYGIEPENDYPYEGKLNNCRFNASYSVTRISYYNDVPSEDEYALQTAVAQGGPVAASIDATDNLQFYSGGLFNDNTCTPWFLNHGVLVVGYGSESGYDYWIVKNSWGAEWGESGYFKLLRNYDNLCGIATTAYYPIL